MWTTREPCVPTLRAPPAPPVPQWWRGWEALAYRLRGAALQVWHAKRGCSSRNLSSRRWIVWVAQTWQAAVKPARLTGAASALVILLQRAHRTRHHSVLAHNSPLQSDGKGTSVGHSAVVGWPASRKHREEVGSPAHHPASRTTGAGVNPPQRV